MQVTDILDMDAIRREVEAGFITERSHPEFLELRILNYTDKAQWEQRWNNETRNCRGLIYNADTLELVARGMPKWFNLGHEGFAPDLSPDDPVQAFVKWDGSLGILYTRPDGKASIATRGSFSSEQAIRANEMLPEAFPPPTPGFTTVFEIIFPENRIVVDYGDRAFLAHLGVVEDATGRFVPNNDNRVYAKTLRDVFEYKFDGDEGFILRTQSGEVLKYKHSEYLALHRIVSSLTEKEVWRQLRAGTFASFAAALPDEFYRWALDTAVKLGEEFYQRESVAKNYEEYVSWPGNELPTRKDKAQWLASETPGWVRGLVFSLLDGRDITDAVWKMIEPKGSER